MNNFKKNENAGTNRKEEPMAEAEVADMGPSSPPAPLLLPAGGVVVVGMLRPHHPYRTRHPRSDISPPAHAASIGPPGGRRRRGAPSAQSSATPALPGRQGGTAPGADSERRRQELLPGVARTAETRGDGIAPSTVTLETHRRRGSLVKYDAVPSRAETGTLYLVRPHEADEENGRKSDGEDVDTPEPGPLLGGHEEALDDTRLEYTDTVTVDVTNHSGGRP
ncbi:hypothetical protein EYF80_023780 [Liparis tanakae]|uniref:Uncharacterized protein n=1 Tax=Liparis tanakae TaxID=230148 RepID=A0A4Z2HM53_9TELE|nr:hypothetical protein EYF80_023780 [Liparis tanakae]